MSIHNDIGAGVNLHTFFNLNTKGKCAVSFTTGRHYLGKMHPAPIR